MAIQRLPEYPYPRSLESMEDINDYLKDLFISLENNDAMRLYELGAVATAVDLDDIVDGTYGKVLSTDITAGHILLTETTGDLDDIADGTTYAKVLNADITAGHILMTAVTGDLDDITDGSSYGKVATTSISAGKIVVAGLDSDATVRMFTDSTTQTNIEAWRHASNVTLIDGGDIYTGSVTAQKLTIGPSPNLIKSKYSDFQSFANGDVVGVVSLGTSTCDTGTFYIGDRCLKMIATDTNEFVFLGSSGTDYNIRLKPSTKYIISAYAKAAAGTPDFAFRLRYDDGNYSALPGGNITTSWVRYEEEITTSAGVTNSGILMFYNGTNGTTIWFDAIQVEEASAAASPEASPYAPSGTVEIHGGQIEAATIDVLQLKVGSDANVEDTLNIYQGEDKTQIFRLRSAGLDHEITQGGGEGYDWGAPTDCYYYMRKKDVNLGGVHFTSFGEATLDISYEIFAVYGAASTAKTTAATGAINFAALKADAANHTYKACANEENLFCLKTKPFGGTYQAVFIIDEDGDVFHDGTAAAFQHEDDVEMLGELEDILADKIPRGQMKEKRVSKKHKVVHVAEVDEIDPLGNKTGEKNFSRMVSTKKLNMLLMGSIRQMNARIKELEAN